MLRRAGTAETLRAKAGRGKDGRRKSSAAAAIANKAFQRYEEAWFNFHRYDEDGSGTIDMNELQNLLKDLKLHMGRAYQSEEKMQIWIEREMKKNDANGDGVLNFEEFLSYYNKFVAQHRSQIDELYTIDNDNILGQGAFGVVVRGVRLATNAGCAVKRLSKEGIKANIELLHNEIAVWEALDHPHLVKLLDVFEEPDNLILITELMRGGDLFQRLTESADGRFAEPVAARLSAQIVAAVAYLHSHGVVHCDLKPSNILVEEPAECDVSAITVKVADFGLSQTIQVAQKGDAANDEEGDEPAQDDQEADDAEDESLLAEASSSSASPKRKSQRRKSTLKMVCGTPNYFAPELVALAQRHFDAEEYDAAVDNWALGCVLWELLVGSPPFLAKEEDILFFKITDNSLDFPSHVSDEAKGLILALTKSNPDERLSSAEALQHPWLSTHAQAPEAPSE